MHWLEKQETETEIPPLIIFLGLWADAFHLIRTLTSAMTIHSSSLSWKMGYLGDRSGRGALPLLPSNTPMWWAYRDRPAWASTACTQGLLGAAVDWGPCTSFFLAPRQPREERASGELTLSPPAASGSVSLDKPFPTLGLNYRITRGKQALVDMANPTDSAEPLPSLCTVPPSLPNFFLSQREQLAPSTLQRS